MVRINFVRKLKNIINEKGYTQTTLKKGEGFVPYNNLNIKWGQVDVEKYRIRLYPGRYQKEELSGLLHLNFKAKRKRMTGFYFEKTDKTYPPFHDVIVISLYNDFFDSAKYNPTKLFDFRRWLYEFRVSGFTLGDSRMDIFYYVLNVRIFSV